MCTPLTLPHIVRRTRGQADQSLKAGDSLLNVRDAIHIVIAGSDGASVGSTWIVDKDLPLAAAAP